MATERQSPDAILAQTGFSSCAVTDIDDDPDAADANWCTASGNNTNVNVRTSFPTPTGNPTVGADLQEFKFQVRRTSGSGTVDPEARAELWENGVLVRAGAENTVTSDTGQVFSFTWNANELATADGSLVECNIVGTKSGGAPAKRSAVDVGAVEWNVTFDAGGSNFTQSLAATATPVGTFVRKTSKPVSSTATPVGTIVRKTFISLSGAATAVGNITRKTLKRLSSTATALATIATSRIFFQTLAATASAVGSIRRKTLKAVSATANASGSISRKVSKSISTTASAVGSVSKKVSISLASTATALATLSANLVEAVTESLSKTVKFGKWLRFGKF